MLLLGLSVPGLSWAQAPAGNAARADLARQVRIDAALFQRSRPLPAHPNNGDELRHPTHFANYSKGLPHDAIGTVDPTAYQAMLAALLSGSAMDFENIPLGGTRKLVNPQAAYSFTLIGPDPHALAIRPAPEYSSVETADEMEELYWMSLVRDVSFNQYATTTLITTAAQRLNSLRQYRGAKTEAGTVTPDVVFRGDLAPARRGPFVSQFLLKSIPYSAGPFITFRSEPTGHQVLEQLFLERRAGDDRVTQYEEWLDIQNGQVPTLNGGLIDQEDDYVSNALNNRVYLYNARALAEYVHTDYPLQATLSAALLIARQGDFLPNGSYDPDPKSSPLASDALNPYLSYAKQEAFVTLGNADALSASTLVTTTALQADWYQKWLVHRRLRPEEFGGHVDNHLSGRQVYPIHTELLSSPVLAQVFSNNTELNRQRDLPGGGTYLLPQAFPEGSPLHPAYGSGHSAYIGAGVTMLKAFFKDFPVRNPQMANDTGSSLVSYTGGTLMMFDELDKLASNIGVARLFAGVHWRSDHDSAVRLGELVALRTLQDLVRTYHEKFPGFEVRTFSGDTLTITANSPVLPSMVTSVESFSLVDRATGGPVPGYSPLENGQIIDLSDLMAQGVRQPVIQATTYEPVVGSVRFVLDAASSTDNGAPYTVGLPVTVGAHALRASPYCGAAATGLGGIPLAIRFTVQN
ncbi:phosphoesterase [Corallococcus llansteffanensis]|uniref:Phosphoesterase n=1 Tax=Corallococcus llansteffanensis TaxID=2316731 RepID=A0A3A8NL69_9BACT|nr:phosphoesterase [Corallococcus llansteffanensis]